MWLAFLLGLVAHAEVALPTISLGAFAPGREWVWDYISKADGSLYSSEKYTVLSQDGNDYVWIEMSTKMPKQGGFTAHHRFHVPVAQCLKAYRNSAEFKPYYLEMYHWENGRWESFDPIAQDSAFEEKFNCNPRFDSTDRKFKLETKSEGKLFRLVKWVRFPSSWYHLDGPHAGTAAEKDFGDRFYFKLRE